MAKQNPKAAARKTAGDEDTAPSSGSTIDGHPVATNPGSTPEGPIAPESHTAEAARTGTTDPTAALESGRIVTPMRTPESGGNVVFVRDIPGTAPPTEMRAVKPDQADAMVAKGWKRAETLYRYLPGRPIGRRELKAFADADVEAAVKAGWQRPNTEAGGVGGALAPAEAVEVKPRKPSRKAA